MTVPAPALTAQQTDLARELREVLTRHNVEGAFRLMFTPHQLDLGADEVLVQQVDADRRVVVLRPRRLSELGPKDVLHETQTVDPSDAALGDYAQEARASNCVVSTLDGRTSHFYVM